MILLKQFNSIERELLAVEDALKSVAAAPLELLREAFNSLSGGKRLRPGLFLLTGRFCRKPDESLDDLVPLAASLELIHSSSLMHDDVIDEAHLRRGRQTANAAFGNKAAILAGDYLFASIFDIVADCDYPKSVGLKLARLLKTLAVGEIEQDSSLFAVPSIEGYLHRIGQKTAGFLAVCAECGALAAGADEATAAIFKDYGFNLGLAFQITDDILDFTGGNASFGKEAGSDLKQGVVTLPVILALETLDEAKRKRLLTIVQSPEMTASELKEALAIVAASGGLTRAADLAADYSTKAKSIIAGLSSESANKTSLTDDFNCLADFVVERKS